MLLATWPGMNLLKKANVVYQYTTEQRNRAFAQEIQMQGYAMKQLPRYQILVVRPSIMTMSLQLMLFTTSPVPQQSPQERREPTILDKTN